MKPGRVPAQLADLRGDINRLCIVAPETLECPGLEKMPNYFVTARTAALVLGAPLDPYLAMRDFTRFVGHFGIGVVLDGEYPISAYVAVMPMRSADDGITRITLLWYVRFYDATGWEIMAGHQPLGTVGDSEVFAELDWEQWIAKEGLTVSAEERRSRIVATVVAGVINVLPQERLFTAEEVSAASRKAHGPLRPADAVRVIDTRPHVQAEVDEYAEIESSGRRPPRRHPVRAHWRWIHEHSRRILVHAHYRGAGEALTGPAVYVR